MNFNDLAVNSKQLFVAGFLSATLLLSLPIASAAQTQETPEVPKATATQLPAQPTPAPSHHSSPYVTTHFTPTERRYYATKWGVEILSVKMVSSGQMIRFVYKILDVNKAKTLNDEKLTPSLIDEKTGARLEVPVLEKVGQLRQVAPPEQGRDYWMVFSNKAGIVKAGNRVDIVIGNFRANGLVVEPVQAVATTKP